MKKEELTDLEIAKLETHQQFDQLVKYFDSPFRRFARLLGFGFHYDRIGQNNFNRVVAYVWISLLWNLVIGLAVLSLYLELRGF